MESLEDLRTRINYYRQDDIPNFNKVVFGVAPAVELGIENLTMNFDEIDTVGSTPIESLHIITQFLNSEGEVVLAEKIEGILPLAEHLNDASNMARSISLVEHMFEKLGEPIEPFLTEIKEVIQKADDYLDKAELFINSLIEISDQIN